MCSRILPHFQIPPGSSCFLFFVFDRAVMTIVHRALSSHFLLHTHRLLFETFDSQRQGPGGPSLSSALRTRTFRFSGVILTCLPLL